MYVILSLHSFVDSIADRSLSLKSVLYLSLAGGDPSSDKLHWDGPLDKLAEIIFRMLTFT